VAERVYKAICKLCGVVEINPSNLGLVKERLYDFSASEIATEAGAGVSPGFVRSIRNLLVSPIPKQKRVLYLLHELGKQSSVVSLKALEEKGVPYPTGGVCFKFLQLLNPPPVEIISRQEYRVYPEVMEEYWEIEGFKDTMYKYRGKRRGKASKGLKVL
jgi:hypothetical protein